MQSLCKLNVFFFGIFILPKEPKNWLDNRDEEVREFKRNKISNNWRRERIKKTGKEECVLSVHIVEQKENNPHYGSEWQIIKIKKIVWITTHLNTLFVLNSNSISSHGNSNIIVYWDSCLCGTSFTCTETLDKYGFCLAKCKKEEAKKRLSKCSYL